MYFSLSEDFRSHVLLIVYYVPNIAKRRVYDISVSIYIDDWPVDQLQMTDFSIAKIWMEMYSQRVIQSTSCLVLGWGFRGRRIEWRYFRLHQIPDGGWEPVQSSWKIEMAISVGHLMTLFHSRVEFSWSVDRVVVFPVWPNPGWRLGCFEKFECRYLLSGSFWFTPCLVLG